MELYSLVKGENIPSALRETITKEIFEFEQRILELREKEEKHNQLVEDFNQTERALRESEEKYRSLVERAYDGIAIVQDFNVVFLNQQFAKMLGFTVEEILNTPYRNYTHPDLTLEINGRYQARIAGERVPSIYETKLVKKNKDPIDVEFNVGVITYQGKPATLTYVRDITERKKSAQALQRSEERFRAFLYSATDAIDLWDYNLNLIDCNQAVLDTFPTEIQKEDLIGKNILDIIPDLKESGRYEKYLEVLNTGKPHYLESFESHPKFGKSFFSVQAFKVGDGLGMITRDVTNQKLAEQTRRELEERRDNFVWMTSHELRTPLTVISGYINFLDKNLKNIDFNKQNQIFETMKRNLRRLERLTDNVSLIAQLKISSFNIEKTEFNFCIFFNEVVEQYKTLLGDQFHADECQCEDSLIIEGDKTRLQQVLDNLLSNAIKHTHPDHRVIQLNLETLSPLIKIKVTDNGAGIAAGDLEKIFEQFVSVKTEFSSSGTGLGLYLSRKILEGHNGAIEAQSSGKGQGASFTITLPG